MSERKFTWFPKMTRVVSSVPNEADRCRLIMAIIEYGTYGTEPSLEYPICSIFEGLRDDIDNSVGARERNKGGRPKKEETENGGFEPIENPETEVSVYKNGGFEVSETQETGVSTSENGGFRVLENPETGVSEHKNGGFAVSENPETPPLYTNPVHTSTDHTKPKESKRRFTPPSPTEVAEYAKTRGQPNFPAERFYDFYESKGWRIGSASMKDWKAAVRNWIRTETEHQKAVNDGKVDLNAFSAIPDF